MGEKKLEEFERKLGLEEVLERMGISKRTLDRLIKYKGFPVEQYVKGGKRKFYWSRITKWEKEHQKIHGR